MRGGTSSHQVQELRHSSILTSGVPVQVVAMRAAAASAQGMTARATRPRRDVGVAAPLRASCPSSA